MKMSSVCAVVAGLVVVANPLSGAIFATGAVVNKMIENHKDVDDATMSKCFDTIYNGYLTVCENSVAKEGYSINLQRVRDLRHVYGMSSLDALKIVKDLGYTLGGSRCPFN